MNPRLVLGVHPCSRGFGWSLFESPHAAFDWGTVRVRPRRNPLVLARFNTLLSRYDPDVLVLEQYDLPGTQRSERMYGLRHAIAQSAESCGIAVHTFSRSEIRQTFALSGARTRHEIAVAIAERIPVLQPRLPRKQAIWEGEPAYLSAFSATACVLTYYANQSKRS
jgi:hypothetical protein